MRNSLPPSPYLGYGHPRSLFRVQPPPPPMQRTATPAPLMGPAAILHFCYCSRGDFQLLKMALLFKIIYFAEKTVNCFSLPPLNLKRALNRCSSKILIVVKMLYDGCLKLDYRFLNTKSDAPPTCGGMKVTVRQPQNFIDTPFLLQILMDYPILFHLFLYKFLEVHLILVTSTIAKFLNVACHLKDFSTFESFTFPSSWCAKFIVLLHK